MIRRPDPVALGLMLGVWTLCAAMLTVDFDTFNYQRGMVGEWWRFLTAPLVHYNAVHAVGNLAALAVLGIAAGCCLSAARLTVLVTLTLAGSMVLLHVALDGFRVYAGVSPLNYGLLGAVLGRVAVDRPVPALGLCVVAAVAQFGGAAGGHGLLHIDGVRPVWQLHAFAGVVGFLLGLAGGLVLRSPDRSPRSTAGPLP